MKTKLKCIEVGTCTNGLHFLFGMKQLIGKEFTVEKGSTGNYYGKETGFFFAPEWLEFIPEEKTMKAKVLPIKVGTLYNGVYFVESMKSLIGKVIEVEPHSSHGNVYWRTECGLDWTFPAAWLDFDYNKPKETYMKAKVKRIASGTRSSNGILFTGDMKDYWDKVIEVCIDPTVQNNDHCVYESWTVKAGFPHFDPAWLDFDYDKPSKPEEKTMKPELIKARVKNITVGTEVNSILFVRSMCQYIGCVIEVEPDTVYNRLGHYYQDGEDGGWTYVAEWLDFDYDKPVKKDIKVGDHVIILNSSASPMPVGSEGIVKEVLNIGADLGANHGYIQCMVLPVISIEGYKNIQWAFMSKSLRVIESPSITKDFPVLKIEGSKTIAKWPDGHTTYAVQNPVDQFDPRIGLAMCVLHEHYTNDEINKMLKTIEVKKELTPFQKEAEQLRVNTSYYTAAQACKQIPFEACKIYLGSEKDMNCYKDCPLNDISLCTDAEKIAAFIKKFGVK